MVMRVGHRDAVRVVAVDADAAPVPTGAVVAHAPVVRRVRVVAVPAHHQRPRRPVVVDPAVVVRVVEHEVAVDVVVPGAAPVHAREGLDWIGVRVDVRDDLDAVPGGELVVADRAAVGDRALLDVVALDDLDVVALARLGDDGVGRRVQRHRIGTAHLPVGAAADHEQGAQDRPDACQPVQRLPEVLRVPHRHANKH